MFPPQSCGDTIFFPHSSLGFFVSSNQIRRQCVPCPLISVNSIKSSLRVQRYPNEIRILAGPHSTQGRGGSLGITGLTTLLLPSLPVIWWSGKRELSSDTIPMQDLQPKELSSNDLASNLSSLPCEPINLGGVYSAKPHPPCVEEGGRQQTNLLPRTCLFTQQIFECCSTRHTQDLNQRTHQRPLLSLREGEHNRQR